jgi:hypothetical protein
MVASRTFIFMLLIVGNVLAQTDTMMMEDYPVEIEKKVVEEYINKYSGIKDNQFQDKYFEYYVLNNRNIIIYSTLLRKGLVYPDFLPFKQMYNPNVWKDRYQDDIENYIKMDEKLKDYIEVLNKKLKIEIDIENNSTEYFKFLSGKITEFGLLKASKEIYIPLNVYLGEKIRQRVNGEWCLEIVNIGLVSTHMPIIKSGKDKYYTGFLLESLTTNNDLHLESLILINSSKGLGDIDAK